MKTTLLQRTSPRLRQRTRQGPGIQLASQNEKTPRWAAMCATAGAAVWAGIAVLARMGMARVGAIELLFLFAPLVIVPLGMELARIMGIGGGLDELAQWWQPVGAGSAVVSMFLPPGRTAGLAALGWLLICVLLAGAGFVRQLAENILSKRPETRVVYMTGYTDDMVVQYRVLEPGVELLQKPFTKVDLGLKVRSTLDGK